jgi:hypothetical protein
MPYRGAELSLMLGIDRTGRITMDTIKPDPDDFAETPHTEGALQPCEVGHRFAGQSRQSALSGTSASLPAPTPSPTSASVSIRHAPPASTSAGRNRDL